jgi:hypothetical protein
VKFLEFPLLVCALNSRRDKRTLEADKKLTHYFRIAFVGFENLPGEFSVELPELSCGNQPEKMSLCFGLHEFSRLARIVSNIPVK